MADLTAGEALLVMATDPEAPIDLAAWAAEEGHGYEERRLAGWMEFVIRKGELSGAA
jgi:TusA-related sulfurtransferase